MPAVVLFSTFALLAACASGGRKAESQSQPAQQQQPQPAQPEADQPLAQKYNSWASGSSDRSLPTDMGKIIADYVLAVVPSR